MERKVTTEPEKSPLDSEKVDNERRKVGGKPANLAVETGKVNERVKVSKS